YRGGVRFARESILPTVPKAKNGRFDEPIQSGSQPHGDREGHRYRQNIRSASNARVAMKQRAQRESEDRLVHDVNPVGDYSKLSEKGKTKESRSPTFALEQGNQEQA